MKFNHLITVILFLVILYFFCMLIQYLTIEDFENYNKPNLSHVFTEYSCPNQSYSYQINRNYCTTDLFCPNKDDICVNQHCVPQGAPAPLPILQDCPGCAKPGLIPGNLRTA